jgi:hypothetical protein
MTVYTILLLLLISLYTAWRYSKTEADPDWAYFNLWGFTGAKYGKDFPDCKTPFIHLYYLGLSKIVGADVARVKFANHFLMGLGGIAVYLLSGNFFAGLAFTVLVNSAWLLSFHGNVGQIPALFLALALLVDQPLISILLLLGATAVEPKLAPSTIFVALVSGWSPYYYLGALIALLLIVVVIFVIKRQWFDWIWESSVTIPLEMAKGRRITGNPFPWFTAISLVFLLPWLGLAVVANPDLAYWIPAALFILVTISGRVLRPNHLIPVVAWIVVANPDPTMVVILVATEFISSGLYLGDVWDRFYPPLAESNHEAMLAGKYLRNVDGIIWVNSLHSGVYIHARRPPPFGLPEQVEIRDVVPERREIMRDLWRQSPPDWVVLGDSPGVKFRNIGYKQYQTFGNFSIYKKVNHA